MPELPEVEIVRRGLEPVLVGARVIRLTQNRPDLRFPLPDNFAHRLQGQEIHALGRRAKYLLASLSSGETLLAHLGMTGRWSINGGHQTDPVTRAIGPYVRDVGADPRHDHIVMQLDTGASITFNDPRRFGFMLLIPTAELAHNALLSGLGPEPLGPDFTPQYLAAKAARRDVDLKALLLDQRTVAGLGNIYVSEALYRARISPFRRARTLARADGGPAARTAALVQAIRSVLTEAIAAGGSTLRDYRQADGSNGRFQERFDVYDREGEPCRRPGCGGVIGRTVQHGRSTFTCGGCQR